jgi:hypothetical protein
MDMTEIATFIRELGVPIAAMVALAVVLYKIGTICGSLLIDAWKAKDTRLGELEKRVETINNGQREALERRLDVSIRQQKENTEALDRVGGCLDRLGGAFQMFAKERPCIHDSDVAKIMDENGDDITPDPKTLEALGRRQARLAKREQGKSKE